MRIAHCDTVHPSVSLAREGDTDAGDAQAGGRATVLEGLGMPGMGARAKAEQVDLDEVEARPYLATRMIVEASR